MPQQIVLVQTVRPRSKRMEDAIIWGNKNEQIIWRTIINTAYGLIIPGSWSMKTILLLTDYLFVLSLFSSLIHLYLSPLCSLSFLSYLLLIILYIIILIFLLLIITGFLGYQNSLKWLNTTYFNQVNIELSFFYTNNFTFWFSKLSETNF